MCRLHSSRDAQCLVGLGSMPAELARVQGNILPFHDTHRAHLTLRAQGHSQCKFAADGLQCPRNDFTPFGGGAVHRCHTLCFSYALLAAATSQKSWNMAQDRRDCRTYSPRLRISPLDCAGISSNHASESLLSLRRNQKPGILPAWSVAGTVPVRGVAAVAAWPRWPRPRPRRSWRRPDSWKCGNEG